MADIISNLEDYQLFELKFKGRKDIVIENEIQSSGRKVTQVLSLRTSHSLSLQELTKDQVRATMETLKTSLLNNTKIGVNTDKFPEFLFGSGVVEFWADTKTMKVGKLEDVFTLSIDLSLTGV